MQPTSLRQRLICGVTGLLSLWLFSLSADGHDGFDNSIHATLRADSLEVSVVLGADAANRILKSATPQNPLTLGGMGVKILPTELAPHFVELKSGTTILVANQFNVVGDGLEYAFTATFPRPPTGPLSFRAPYFDTIEQMKRGTLVLTDENGNPIGSGPLSQGSAGVTLVLASAQTPAAGAVESGNSPTSATTIAASDGAPIKPSTTAARSSQAPSTMATWLNSGIARFGWLIVLLMLAALAALWLSQRRPS